MQRRRFIETAAAGSIVGIAGCQGSPSGTDTSDGGIGTPTPESGEEDNYEQVREIELMTFTRDFAPLRYQAVNETRNAWQELGVSVNLRSAELSTLFAEYNEQTYDATLMWFSTGADRADPSFYINLFKSEYIDTSGVNPAAFDSEEYDEYANTALTSTDEEERVQAAKDAQRVLAEEQPVFWLFHRDTLSITNSNQFTGWEPHVGNQPFWTVKSLMSAESQGESTMVYAGKQAETLTSNMNPMGADANSDQATGRMVWDRLIMTNLAGEPEPWLATDWEIDGTTVDLEIRDDVTWHDGEELTAEDVKFTIDYMLEWDVVGFSSFYEPIESIEQTGDYSVSIQLNSQNPSFVSGPLTRLWMLPKHVWDGVTEERDLDHPSNWSQNVDRTGSGPFVFESYEPGSEVVFSKNEDHFAADEFDFDRLIWSIFGSGTAAVGAVENGNAAFTQGVQPQQYERAQETSNIKGKSNASFGWTGIFLNNSKSPFDSTSFRQALAHVVDTEDLVQVAISGYGEPARSPIAPSNEKWHNEDAPQLNGGLETARQVLYDDGYRWDEDGNLLAPV